MNSQKNITRIILLVFFVCLSNVIYAYDDIVTYVKKSIQKGAFEIQPIQDYEKAFIDTKFSLDEIAKLRGEIIQKSQKSISKIKLKDVLKVEHVYTKPSKNALSQDLILLTSNTVEYYLRISYLNLSTGKLPLDFDVNIIQNGVLESDSIFEFLPFILNEYVFFQSSYSNKRKLNSSFDILSAYVRKKEYLNATVVFNMCQDIISTEQECLYFYSNISHLFDKPVSQLDDSQGINLVNEYLTQLEKSLTTYPNLSNKFTPLLITYYFNKKDYSKFNKAINELSCDSILIIEKIKPLFIICDIDEIHLSNDMINCIDIPDTTSFNFIADQDTVVAGDYYTGTIHIKTNEFHPSECEAWYFGMPKEIIDGAVKIKFRVPGRPEPGIFKKTIPIKVKFGDNYILQDIEYYVQR